MKTEKFTKEDAINVFYIITLIMIGYFLGYLQASIACLQYVLP